MKLVNLWIRRFQISLHKEMMYRWSFLFSIIGIILIDLFKPILVIIIYSLSPGIPGWNMYEFILLIGIFNIVVGTWHFLFSGISWLTTHLVLHGEFDNIMVRPYDTLIYLMTGGIDLDGVGQIGAGIAVTLFAISQLSISINLLNVVYMLLFMFLALIFTFSISVFIAGLSVRFVQATSLLDLFWHTIGFGKNPLTVYGSFGQFFFTFIIPFGLAAFYPAQALLGVVGFDILIKSAVVTLAVLFVSVYFWRYSLHSYSSAGG